MEKAKLILMTTSLVFVALCCGASVYFSLVLPDGDPNLPTFYFMDFVFAAAFIWFGWNVYSLWKSRI
ncbi:MAG: hypothetical protein MJZ36_05130 [Bacteroidaceae bacterium]|nr:hypothetical protein [Bacteroidaceae bacterium]